MIMTNAITNKLAVSFNHKQIDDDFCFFQLTTSDKYIAKGAYVLDRPDLDLKALSVAFDYGRTAFVLFNKKDAPDKKGFIDSLGDEKLSIKQVYSSDIKDYILFRLFLYSLSNFSTDFLSYNNLTGKLILLDTCWMAKNKKSFKALDIDVDKDMCLLASATTFTATSLIKDKKALKELPKYVVGGKSNSLKRVLTTDDSQITYIRKILGNRKTEIPFLDLSSKKRTQSRAYYLYHTLDAINQTYRNYLSASFKEQKISEKITQIRDKQIIGKTVYDLRFSRINCVNYDLVDSDKSYFDNLVNTLMDTISPNTVSISNEIDSTMYNVAFIHDADYYKDHDYPDPYQSFNRQNVIQCVTKEDVGTKLDDNSKAIINSCLKELVIKDDILHKKRISLDKWEDFNFESDWIFGIEVDGIQYFMVIHQNGSFELEYKSDDFLSFNNKILNPLSYLLSQSSSKSKTLISDGKGNINLISRTTVSTMPSKEIFTAEGIRSKEGRDVYLSGVTDINFYQDQDNFSYNVGIIGNGMNSSLSKASLIYNVETIQGENIVKSILKTMSVIFVKYNEFTVLPYPVKYLREYMKIVGLKPNKNKQAK